MITRRSSPGRARFRTTRFPRATRSACRLFLQLEALSGDGLWRRAAEQLLTHGGLASRPASDRLRPLADFGRDRQPPPAPAGHCRRSLRTRRGGTGTGGLGSLRAGARARRRHRRKARPPSRPRSHRRRSGGVPVLQLHLPPADCRRGRACPPARKWPGCRGDRELTWAAWARAANSGRLALGSPWLTGPAGARVRRRAPRSTRRARRADEDPPLRQAPGGAQPGT